jgi:hypothetical protein
VEEPQPTPSTDEAPAIDEKPPRKVKWVRFSKNESREVEPEDIQVGKVLYRITRPKRGRYHWRTDDWVVTAVRENGIFKAIPKKKFDNAVKEAQRVPWLGAWISAFMVFTGHPPARIILMLFADTKYAEVFTTDSAPHDALPFPPPYTDDV